MTIVLLPCGASDWREAGRLLGRVELPLSDEGEAECCGWVERLRPLGISKIFHSPDELATATADALAERLGVQSKALTALCEVDMGLWAGLTEEELEARYEAAHRELCEAPLNVSAPEGEVFADALERLIAAVDKCLQRNGQTGAVGLVLRPLCFAMARCHFEGLDSAKLWEIARDAREPVIIEAHRPTAKRIGAKPAK